jgi:hypothetical protein
MLVLQPLIQGLRSLRIYYRVYESEDGILILDLGSSLNDFWNTDRFSNKVIFGNPASKREVSYKIFEDHYEKVLSSKSIDEFKLKTVEKLLDDCYNFETTHKVIEWKDK